MVSLPGVKANRGRIAALDGVRGLAVLVVILHNGGPQFAAIYLDRLTASGWMGVDLFFVLSGFLITGILLDTNGSDHYFKNFYARRCLRIWPLYFAVLVFMWVVVPRVSPAVGSDIAGRSSPWWGYPIFLQNFLVPKITSAAGPLGASWSLAVEEQFYLFWPIVVRFTSRRRLAQIAAGLIVASPLIRLFLQATGAYIYFNTFCRLDGLMAGALLAILVRGDHFASKRFMGVAWTVLMIAAPLALGLDALFREEWFVFSLSVIASAAFVYLAMFSDGRLTAIMTNRFLVFTGTISYALYLLHKIPFDAAKAQGWERHPLIALPLLLVVTYAAAVTSWYILEQPVLRLKRFFVAGPRRLSADFAPTAG